MIPAAPSPIFAELLPISAELSPIPAALSRSAGADAATPFVARLTKHHKTPLWNLSSTNRVTPVSIQNGVYHGITFAAISTIPAAPSPISAELLPISAELSPIPMVLSRSLRRSAAARRCRSLRDSLNIINHC